MARALLPGPIYMPTLRSAFPLLLSSMVAAQTVVLAPSQAASMDGADSTSLVFYGGSAPRAHSQILLATSDIAASAGTIQALSFRPTSSQFDSPAYSVNLRIVMSVSTAPFSAASPTFAQNHGPNPVVVFDGLFTMPLVPATGAVPPSPLPPIVFTTPFAYDPALGETLVIDVSARNPVPGTSYALGLTGIGGGSMSSIYSSGACVTSSGGYQGTIGYGGGQPYPGGTFTVGYFGYPNNRASFHTSMMLFDLSMTGVYGSFALPTPLVNLGFPANAPCQLGVVPEVLVPITYVPGSGGGSGGTGGYLLFSMPLPANPTLAGLQFATQAISLDYDNNGGAGVELLFPSQATRWTMGTGARPQAATVTRAADTVPPSPTGGVQQNEAPVVHLHFQ